jgi:alpha-N-arabinofuranosidase
MGPEISRYVYGQFVEHLGRCIRQGIWAEMLRDRKFLQEPGNSWRTLAPPGAAFEASLSPAAAYAGDKGMALRLTSEATGTCGISQSGLGVVSGKEYVGYAILSAVDKATQVSIRLTWGDGPDDGQTVGLAAQPGYRKQSFRFRARRTTDNAALSVTLDAPGHVRLGALSLMPADNVRGMRADTLALVRQIAPPITRWPGGNFVSGYNWKDAIGDRDQRPPRWERAWNDIEDNDFGLDEFMGFCRAVNTEPYICVNAGLGSAGDAADEVEYANGSGKTIWGAKRARNGHPRPYRVVWWGVGNEMYGDWQLGHIAADRYAERHNAFVAAMRARDKGIKIIAVGAPGPWNDTILGRCVASMDLLSGHHYSGRGVRLPMSDADKRKYVEAWPGYSASVAGGVRGIVDDFRKRRVGAAASVKLAIDEWGIVRDWNAAPDGMGIGSFEHYYCLGDALAVARGMNEILRNADVVAMANWAQLVNVIATIKTSRSDACMDPAGYVLAVYGGNLKGRLVPVEAPPGAPLDIVASKDDRDNVLAVAIVNYSLTEDVSLDLDIAGASERSALTWTLGARDLADTNVPGRTEAVPLRALRGLIVPGKVELPRHSLTVIRYATGKKGPVRK